MPGSGMGATGRINPRSRKASATIAITETARRFANRRSAFSSSPNLTEPASGKSKANLVASRISTPSIAGSRCIQSQTSSDNDKERIGLSLRPEPGGRQKEHRAARDGDAVWQLYGPGTRNIQFLARVWRFEA